MLEIYALIKPVLALIWFRDCPRKLQCPRKSCLARKHKTWFSSVLLQRLGQFMVDTPLKFNIDTQSCHIWKEIHCKNHCFWVSIFNFGGVFYQIKCMHVHEGTCPSGERISTLRMTNIRPSLSTPSMNLKPPIMYWMKSRLHGESLRRFTYETWRKITCSSIRLIFSYIFHISPSIYLYIYIYQDHHRSILQTRSEATFAYPDSKYTSHLSMWASLGVQLHFVQCFFVPQGRNTSHRPGVG